MPSPPTKAFSTAGADPVARQRPNPPVLNIVGTGRLGATLARLLADNGSIRLGDLYSRHPERAADAARFCGGGTPRSDLAALADADIWLLSVPDDVIADTARRLADSSRDWRGVTAFHCSGIHTAATLAPLKAQGAHTASLHPAHSFGDRDQSLATFAGTCCTLEGDSEAKTALEPLFAAIGARLLAIEPESKALYHAATAVASNYLVTLLDTSIALLRQTGIGEQDARRLLAPLVNQTSDNLFKRGAVEALTGPIARGDGATVAAHLKALEQHCPDYLPAYRELGLLTLQLANREQKASAEQRAIKALLKSDQ